MPTSPAPDAAAPPGMCPGIVVKGGGGGAGGGSGDGSGGAGGAGGDGSGDGEGTGGDGKSAPDPVKYPDCGTAAHPVDVVTGRAFTHAITDLDLPGPLPFQFQRVYSSTMATRDAGLGFGWAHTLGWWIEVGRREIRVWNDQGLPVAFPAIAVGDEVMGSWGWILRHHAAGFELDADDGVKRRFTCANEGAKRWRLQAIEDRNQNQIALTYDGDRLAEVKDSAGRVIRLRSSPTGRIASIEVKNAVTQGAWVVFAAYEYDTNGNLTSVRDADGFTSRYTYDDEHRMTADVDRTGLAFYFVYGSDGRCIESWGNYPGRADSSLTGDLPTLLADGVTPVKGIYHCKFEYFPNRYSEVSDSTQVRRFFGNARGTLDKSVRGGAVVTATYRDDGHILSRTDAMGATTRFERDPRGRLLKTTDPLGRVTTVERDAYGLPVKVTDPAGAVTTIERDSRGNLRVLRDALGGVTTFAFDERGLLTEIIEPNGAATRMTYDAHGNRSTIVQPDGGIWKHVCDALGRRRATTDPLGATTSYTYSARGDLISVRDAVGGVTHFTYDGEGHLTRITSPQQAVTVLEWGGYHKLVRKIDANGHVARLGYNLEGELTHIFNERGEIHRLYYDSAARLVGEDTFDGRRLRYRNDLCVRPVRIIDERGYIIELAYDEASQLVRRKGWFGAVDAFEYSLSGDVIAARSPTAEVTFERDALGRVVKEVQRFAGEEHAVVVRYDANGRRIGRTTSVGHVENVVRDASGQRIRSELDGHVVQHTPDLLGRDVRRDFVDGGAIESRFDALGRLGDRKVFAARVGATSAAEPAWIGAPRETITVHKAFRYSWDGELVESVDKDHGATEFRYDPVGQLLAMVPAPAKATVGRSTEFFRYDETGNIHDEGPGAEKRVYGKGDRLLQKGDTEYIWDSDGYLIARRTRDPAGGPDESWVYTWNDAGLMASATGPALHVEFSYDSFARRIEKRVYRRPPNLGGGAMPTGSITNRGALLRRVRFVWDGDKLVHELREEATANGDPIVEERTYWFEDDGFEPWAHKEKRCDNVGREWFHYVNDPAGTPERLVDEHGNVAVEYSRKAWGRLDPLPGGRATTPVRMKGQYQDEETGLTYNRFRYYEPALARFVSSDPSRLGGGYNSFAYCPNPTRWTDPAGLVKGVAPPHNGIASYSGGGGTGGHHIHAQAAYRDDPNYSKYSALCVSQDWMDKNKVNHQAMTNKQRECYGKMAAGDPNYPNTPAGHDKVALEALEAGNVDKAQAAALVASSRAQINAAGATQPARIPWS